MSTPSEMFRSNGWSPLLILLTSLLVGSLPLQAADQQPEGLITIESDQQSADNVTGVITASGNVRLVHANRGVVLTIVCGVVARDVARQSSRIHQSQACQMRAASSERACNAAIDGAGARCTREVE